MECADRLEKSWLGRLAGIVDGHPEVFPVNHVYERDRGSLIFPTRAATKLHAALTWPSVAFEVDGLDEDGSGWSVLAVGSAEEETDPVVIAEVIERRHARWALNERSHWLRVLPTKVTGRRISMVQ